METTTRQCDGCKATMRLPAVTVASIFKCPRCSTRIRVEPDPPPASAEPPEEENVGLGAVFSRKVKQLFNVGGVEMVVRVGARLSRSAGRATGQIVLRSQENRRIKRVTCTFNKYVSKGRGEARTSSHTVLGEHVFRDGFDLAPGSEKLLDFSIPFCKDFRLKDIDEVLGTLDAVRGFVQNEVVKFTLEFHADIRGSLRDCHETVHITFDD